MVAVCFMHCIGVSYWNGFVAHCISTSLCLSNSSPDSGPIFPSLSQLMDCAFCSMVLSAKGFFLSMAFFSSLPHDVGGFHLFFADVESHFCKAHLFCLSVSSLLLAKPWTLPDLHNSSANIFLDLILQWTRWRSTFPLVVHAYLDFLLKLSIL